MKTVLHSSEPPAVDAKLAASAHALELDLVDLDTFGLPCPHCGRVVLQGSAEESHAAAPNSYLSAGYMLDEGMGTMPDRERHRDAGWISRVLTGRCGHCDGPYAVLDHRVIASRPSPLWIHIYFHDDASAGPALHRWAVPRTAAAGIHRLPQRWLVMTCDTSLGPLHVHHLGPFRPDDVGLVVPLGEDASKQQRAVSVAAHDLLFNLWKGAWTLACATADAAATSPGRKDLA